MKNSYILVFLTLFVLQNQAQITEKKNVIILNREGFSGGLLSGFGIFHFGHPKMKLNQEVISGAVFENTVVRQIDSAVVLVEIEYPKFFKFIVKQKVMRF